MRSILIGFATTAMLAIGPIVGAVWCAGCAARYRGADFWSAALMGLFLAAVASLTVYLGVLLTLQ